MGESDGEAVAPRAGLGPRRCGGNVALGEKGSGTFYGRGGAFRLRFAPASIG